MIKITQGDISKITVDVIVNAANTSLLGGSGVDGLIHKVGGKAILEECRKIRNKQGRCKIGDAVITTAGNLQAKKVIHTVGPKWSGGKNNEESLLKSCYIKSLNLAIKYNLNSIAFPNISTGRYRFPKKNAAVIALTTTIKFLDKIKIPLECHFVCFESENYNFYLDVYHEILNSDR